MTSIGRYEILARIGAGGMAEVFLAKTSGAAGIEKHLVVKRVSPALAQNRRFLAMFVDEAKIATRLNHPNIVQVYAFERVGDDYLLSMEHVDGVDLGRLLTAYKRSERRLPPAAAAYIAQELAKGLDYAHSRRDDAGVPLEIVHRDVSPQNILLSREGAVKITDFGVAKARLFTEDPGVVKGKLSYMSPEQASGKPVDRRSDVWSLGVVLWECLVGRSLFAVRGPQDLEGTRREPVPSPRTENPDVPAALEQIVLRTLANEPADRFQTAREMSAALGRFLHELPEPFDATSLERIVAEAAGPGLAPGEKPAAGEAVPQEPARRIRERRSIVAAAVDVRGWDELQRSGPSVARATLASLTKIVGDIAYKNDAVLKPGGGVGFRILFGLRQATVQDSLRAVRLGLDVHEAVEGVSRDLSSPLSCGLGIARGEALVSADRKGKLVHWELVGGVAEISEAFARQARDGTVLVGGGAYRMARRDFHFTEDDRVRVPSLAGRGDGAVRSFRLVGHKSREERHREIVHSADAQGGLVGRDLELHALDEVVSDSIGKDRSGCCAVIGETGIGKSALVAQAIKSLPAGTRVVRAECTFATKDLPFEAAAELVRDAFDLPAEPAAMRERVERRVRVLFEDLESGEREKIAEVFESLLGLRPVRIAGGEEEAVERQRMVLLALRGLLERLARRGPLLVVIESIHHADGPSLRLFQDLAHKRYRVPIIGFLVGQPSPRLATLLEGLQRISVGPLEEEDARRLVERRLGSLAALGDLAEEVLDKGAGNPLFLQEIVESLLERGVVSAGSGSRPARLRGGHRGALSLPTTLEGVLASRVDELSQGAREVLRWTAVAGFSVPEPVLASIVGAEGMADSGELVDKGLLTRQGGSVRFASTAVREVAYRSIDPADRARMHRTVGERLVGHGGRRARAARIARHLELGGDRAGAARHYLSAAEAARALYSNRVAMRLYRKALDLLPEDAPDAFAAHEHAEQILRGAGRVEERARTLEAMRRIALATNNRSSEALAWNRLARFHLDHWDVQSARRALANAFRAARAAKDRGASVEALRLLATVHREEGRYAEGIRCCDRALEILGPGRRELVQRGTVLIQKGVLLRRMGRIVESLGAYAEAVVLYQRLAIKRLEAHALSNMSIAACARGDYEDAVRLVRRALALDREIGDRFNLGDKIANLGEALLHAGDRARGRELVDRAMTVFERSNDRLGVADCLMTLAEADVDEGDVASAEARIERVRSLHEDPTTRTPVYDATRLCVVSASVALAAGRHEEAARLAAEGASLAEATTIVPFEAHARSFAAEALSSLGRFEEARAQADRALALARDGKGVDRVERVALAAARVALAAGDADAAHAAVEVARRELDSKEARIRTPALRAAFGASPIWEKVRSLSSG